MKRSLALAPMIVLVLAACSASPSGTAAPTDGPTASPAGGTTTPAGEAVVCAPEATQEDANVAIIDFAFEPDTTSVSAGQVVAFTNTGQAPHTVTFDDGPDCGRVTSGGLTAATFNVAGSYAYHCSIHPEMVASITVDP